jgi:DNA-directed RNA polymerase subunit K/omega
MSDIKKLAQDVDADAVPTNMEPLKDATGNLYKSLSIIASRANQISAKLKEELHSKLEEFATSTDSLEEVAENREQIEISKYYEKLPNAAILAKKEFIEGKVYFRHPDEDEEV